MIDVTPKKNILHYSNRPYGGGEEVSCICVRTGTAGSEYCIDSGINWTEVYSTYGGIKMDIYMTGSYLSDQNFLAGTFGITNSLDNYLHQYPYLAQEPGTFAFLLDPLSSGGQEITRFSTRYNRDSLGFGTFSGNSWTASLQLYNNPDTTDTGYYKKLNLSGGKTGAPINSFTVGPHITYKPTLLTGSRYYNLCIFTDPFCYLNRWSGASVDDRIAYCAWHIYGYDGTTETPLFLGKAWKDQENRGCIKDELSGKLFYSKGTAVPDYY